MREGKLQKRRRRRQRSRVFVRKSCHLNYSLKGKKRYDLLDSGDCGGYTEANNELRGAIRRRREYLEGLGATDFSVTHRNTEAFKRTASAEAA